MYEKIIIMSDIHANLSALEAVIADIRRKRYRPDGVVMLGDLVNYGMRPNETVAAIKQIQYPIAVNIFGNHEKAIFDGDLTEFSTRRGQQILKYTDNCLSSETRDFLNGMNHDGYEFCQWQGKKLLFVHGSMSNPFWGTISSETITDDIYSQYDFVISGHSHIPHLMEHFFPSDDHLFRDKKRTVFLNPGSVGQPRNHNPFAHYVYLDLMTETISFNTVKYNVELERALYPPSLDEFYKDRLLFGI